MDQEKYKELCITKEEFLEKRLPGLIAWLGDRSRPPSSFYMAVEEWGREQFERAYKAENQTDGNGN